MTLSYNFPSAPRNIISVTLENLNKWCLSIANVVNRINTGKINACGDLTLTINSATTTLTDARLTANSCVLFDPVTASAATELYGATMYVLTANRNNGAWTITNANNANADRTFRYLIIG